MATSTGRSLSQQRDKARRAKLPPAKPRTLGTASSMPTLNAAQMGGASGVGFEDSATQAVISTQTEKALKGGASKSVAGDYSEGSYKPTTLSETQATNYLKSFGLTGLVKEEELVGLSPEKANQKALEMRKQRTDQSGALTSSSFNPETMARTKRAIDRFGFSLNEITNTPFNGKQSKINKSQALIDSTSKELARLFKSPEEFQSAYNTNAGFKASIDAFMKKGGDVNNVTSQIAPPATPEQPGAVQDTASYLSDLQNPQANQEAQQKAIDELFPERQLAQDEIARVAGIPAELKAYYMGDEQSTGLVAEQKAQAEEEKRIIEQEEKDDIQNLKATAKHAIAKNKAELKIQEATIEENRLAAKNYMTGYLAKLGALNTTGAAGLALQTLEGKYQTQVNTLRTQARYDNQLVELKLSDSVNKVETDTDKAILKIQQDTSKTNEEIFKEISKAQQAADKEVYRLKDSYATILRTRTTKYTEDLKAEAEKYAKEFAKTAANGLDLFSLSETLDGGLKRSSSKNALQTSYSNVKQNIKKNLPPAISTKIITELTDEEMALFLEDYLSEREGTSSSINPVSFFEDWKSSNGVNQTKANSGGDEEVYQPM